MPQGLGNKPLLMLRHPWGITRRGTELDKALEKIHDPSGKLTE
jgi:hypothetical protein